MEKIILLINFLTLTLILAQESNYILNVKTSEAKSGNSVNIVAELMSSENIQSIELAYKISGENEFKRLEMQLAGTNATVNIPGVDVIPPVIEYYFLINLKDGTSQTYPAEIEKGISPLQLSVQTITDEEEIIVLSPSDNEIVTPSDFLVSVSFIKAPSNIDLNRTKIYLNNIDVSQNLLIAGDLIVLSAENLSNLKYGNTLVKIEVYNKDGNLYQILNRSVQIVTRETAEEIESKLKFNGSIRAESRNEYFNKATLWYNNLSTDLKVTSGDWLVNAQLYTTSEEKKYLQPYNRYTLSIQNGDILKLQLGDSYPQFPNLILNGKRVRGFNGELNLGAFNIQAAYGEIVRKIEGELLEKYLKENAPLAYDIITINEDKYGYPYGRVKLGTYSRNLFAVRPSFGSGENFQLGFTYMHSKDDPNSVEFASRPQENAIISTDLMFAFDEQNIVFTSQAAVSIYNRDISTGTLSDEKIDSIFGEGKAFDIDPDQIKTIKKYLGNIITVNQYIGPLNPQKLASLAGEASISLNYLNNSLKAMYVYRGNDYLSFGQPFIRTDVKGFNVSDRIRMFRNQFFISLGYEKLEDNLQKTKIATTIYETYSVTASLFLRANFPNITLGYNRYKNNNGIKISDTVYNKYIIDDFTERFSLLLSYDVKLGVRHNTLLSITTQKKDDNSLRNADANYNSVTFSINSFWDRNFNSIVQLLYSSTEISQSLYKYFTLTAGAKYRMLENKLSISATISPSFGDFKRQALELLAEYNLFRNLLLTFQARIFRFPGSSTNSIVGLSTRLMF